MLQVLREVNDLGGNGIDPLTYFQFWNVIDQPSSVTQVAIDWGNAPLLGLAFVKNGPDFGTNFVAGGGPPNLPGGGKTRFVTDQVYNSVRPKPFRKVRWGRASTSSTAVPRTYSSSPRLHPTPT